MSDPTKQQLSEALLWWALVDAAVRVGRQRYPGLPVVGVDGAAGANITRNGDRSLIRAKTRNRDVIAEATI